MGFFSGGFLLALILIVVGILILLKTLFNINIPIFPTLFGGFLILIGIQIITNGGIGFHHKSSTFYTKGQKEYNIVFGKMDVDLTSQPFPESVKRIEINTVFGSSFIKVSKNIPMIITVNSAFGGAKMPDGNVISFGKYIYKTENLDETKGYYLVDINVVFGGTFIEEL